MDYGVLYFGTDLETYFGETLARLRPSLELLALVADEWAELGFMNVGAVAADWRQRRTAVHVRLSKGTRFVDVDSPLTHQHLRKELALGLKELDVSTVRGPMRKVTQMISEWVYVNGDGAGGQVAGVRYESRIRSGWECWAVFDDEELELEVLETVPITADMPALQSVAKLFELTVH
jgi:RES domain